MIAGLPQHEDDDLLELLRGASSTLTTLLLWKIRKRWSNILTDKWNE